MFFQRSGCWRAEGIYADCEHGEVPFQGETTLSHGSPWRIDSWIRLQSENEPVFHNHHRFDPPPSGQRVIPWPSDNPGLGELLGRFLLADGLILSYFVSTDGALMGHEALVEEKAHRLRLAGFCFLDGQPLSRWSGFLTREGDG